MVGRPKQILDVRMEVTIDRTPDPERDRRWCRSMSMMLRLLDRFEASQTAAEDPNMNLVEVKGELA